MKRKDEKTVLEMTDLEFLNYWIDTQLQFINPFTFRELQRRGLERYVNLLGADTKEGCRAVMYSRLAKAGKIVGDPEIDLIAGKISLVERLQKELVALPVTEVEKRLPLLTQITGVSTEIKEYFISNKKQA